MWNQLCFIAFLCKPKFVTGLALHEDEPCPIAFEDFVNVPLLILKSGSESDAVVAPDIVAVAVVAPQKALRGAKEEFFGHSNTPQLHSAASTSVPSTKARMPAARRRQTSLILVSFTVPPCSYVDRATAVAPTGAW